MQYSQTSKARLVFIFCITFLLITALVSAQDIHQNFKIVNQTPSQITIDFTLGDWSLESSKDDNGNECKIIKSNSRHALFIGETETLPIYSAMIAIPKGMDIEMDTKDQNMESLKSVNLLNSELIRKETGETSIYPSKQIVSSMPGQLRDFRVISINIYPFQIDTRTNELKVIGSVTLNLRFIPSNEPENYITVGNYSYGFDNLYRSLILNYENMRDQTASPAQPKLLIIYPTGADATFTNKLTEFVTWKRQKGYIVNIASTVSGEAGSSTTTIKTYITNAYNNLSTRPDVVLIIGDPSTGLIVPAFNSDNGDHPYSLITSGDEYPDVQLGRISIETSDQFSNYVAKVMLYERDVNVSTAQWLNKMFLVGDSSHSGISTYYTNHYIHEIAYLINRSYTFNELYGSYGSGMQSTFDSGIREGVGFFNYRGYVGMSGWSPNSTTTNNTNKLNHGVLITCGTGTFVSGTSTTETYMRLGTAASPTGGITAIGMATTSTHTGFNNFLCGGIFDGIFNYGMRTMGEALLYSKSYLRDMYGISNSALTTSFSEYCNLMGDPTVEVFVTIPKTFNVTCPSSILPGTLNFEVTIKNSSNIPLANATVNAWQTGTCNQTASTDENGKAVFTIPSSLTGSITLTVSKHDYKPSIYTINISGSGLIHQSAIIDDDSNGNSIGNNNQIINAGETIEYSPRVKNTSVASISSIVGTITCTDPYITLIQIT